jgi:hypothetical protein
MDTGLKGVEEAKESEEIVLPVLMMMATPVISFFVSDRDPSSKSDFWSAFIPYVYDMNRTE